uniref:Uncharacterized protein n=1 Tax=Avena sativa TaxID=4498 RepID=A0ACD5UCL5_AVESA
MDRADYLQRQQHHPYLMPPPVPVQQQQQQMCVPTMMDDMDEQQFSAGRGGGRAERKRRFTEEQIRSLESTFHAHHAKLEPREKAELARELGLQPRQVAIWFQNKRARWRSKQLEHDFAALRAKYDALHSRVDSLKQENLTLAGQLHELSERLRERDGSGGATTATASSSSCNNGGGEELGDDKRKVVVVPGSVDVEPLESCVLGGTTPADVSVESDCDDHLCYDGAGFPADPFCATPELWEPWPWPPVEWNAVA